MCYFASSDTRNLGEYSFTMQLRLHILCIFVVFCFFLRQTLPPKKPKILMERVDEVSHWGATVSYLLTFG